ncbi:hypothetical protein ACFQ0Q_01665 [Streptomyces aureus]
MNVPPHFDGRTGHLSQDQVSPSRQILTDGEFEDMFITGVIVEHVGEGSDASSAAAATRRRM